MRPIRQITYHQTGYPNDTVESITRWHTTAPGDDPKNPKGLGWSHIGYHFIFTPDAVLHKTLAQGVVGNHCRGDNADSIGICCVGAGAAFPLDKGYMTLAMFEGLLRLTRQLLVAYPTIRSLWGHRERASGIEQRKSCPGFEVDVLRALLT